MHLDFWRRRTQSFIVSIHTIICGPHLGLTALVMGAQGILAPADAQMAVAAGVNGIMLSNHGGRQLDYAPSPVEMLPHGETTLYRAGRPRFHFA